MNGPNALSTAESLLRTLGGRTVLLRMPQPAIPGDPAEQTGLATPLFRDLPLQPAVLRRSLPATARVSPASASASASASAEATQYDLLVPATAVLRLAGTLAPGPTETQPEALFTDAAGVVAGNTLLRITGISTAQTAGQVYLYRISLTGPARLV